MDDLSPRMYFVLHYIIEALISEPSTLSPSFLYRWLSYLGRKSSHIQNWSRKPTCPRCTTSSTRTKVFHCFINVNDGDGNRCNASSDDIKPDSHYLCATKRGNVLGYFCLAFILPSKRRNLWHFPICAGSSIHLTLQRRLAAMNKPITRGLKGDAAVRTITELLGRTSLRALLAALLVLQNIALCSVEFRQLGFRIFREIRPGQRRDKNQI